MKVSNKKFFATILAGAFAVAGLVLAPASSAKAKDEDQKDNED